LEIVPAKDSHRGESHAKLLDWIHMPTSAPAPYVESSEQDQLTPLWNVVLLDDDEHTYDYVIEMLVKLFFKTVQEAYHHAVEVDTAGRTVLLTCEREAAEFARDQVHGYGKDWRMPKCKGSMSAVLEPAAGGSYSGA
jgi:ATP-dependent Clp protease adaptor protein ClpS